MKIKTEELITGISLIAFFVLLVVAIVMDKW